MAEPDKVWGSPSVPSTRMGGLLRRVGNRSRIASIGGKAVILGRLAGGRSDVRRIRRVWCEWVRRVVRLGRRWGHCIHIDAFAIGPRSGRVLRGRDAGAQKQCRESERNVRHRVVLALPPRQRNANTAIQVPPALAVARPRTGAARHNGDRRKSERSLRCQGP
jgi:hypothetical protein